MSVPLSDVGMEWLLQRSLALLWSYHDKRDETWEYMNQRENAYNVGCMLYGYRPVRLNEIVKANRTI